MSDTKSKNVLKVIIKTILVWLFIFGLLFLVIGVLFKFLFIGQDDLISNATTTVFVSYVYDELRGKSDELPFDRTDNRFSSSVIQIVEKENKYLFQGIESNKLVLFAPEIAKTLDEKLDDGDSSTGKIVGRGVGDCAKASDLYNIETEIPCIEINISQ